MIELVIASMLPVAMLEQQLALPSRAECLERRWELLRRSDTCWRDWTPFQSMPCPSAHTGMYWKRKHSSKTAHTAHLPEPQ